MRVLEHVPIEAMDPLRFSSVFEPSEYAALEQLIATGARELQGRVIWNVSSTAKGGGVVELLRPLLGYSRGGGVDARWAVVSGSPEFFGLTKRLHNHLHGFDGDKAGVSAPERAIYEGTLAASAVELVKVVERKDIVILHDPQTAGLIPAVRETGATVIWRCHVGIDHPNLYAREAWDFLRGYVQQADAYVFSRATFAWEGLEQDKIAVIQPTIDAFSPKNAVQGTEQTLSILSSAGIIPSVADAAPTFTRSDDTPGRVSHRAGLIEVAPLRPEDRFVLQVSRWDRLKDPIGVINSFAAHVADHTDAHLMLAGPSTESVADDPEGAGVYAAVCKAWDALPDRVRRRVHLASLPMDDIEENAAIVNALQRRATVVVQKSLAEGFGLTVAEAMWKERAMVASRIGGIQDQIVDGESGLLIADPRDLTEFGSLVLGLLNDRERARQIGVAARVRVRDHFLGPYSLSRYSALIQKLVGAAGAIPGPELVA
jgi:trehalose synthase